MTNTNRREADARRNGTHVVEPIGDASMPRVRCHALACSMRARYTATYRGITHQLCPVHARAYVEWGERDRFQMAQALWSWETPADVVRIHGIQPEAPDAPLPARGRTAAVRQATRSTFNSGRRSESDGNR